MRENKDTELTISERETLTDAGKIFQDIKQSARIALEHQASKAFRNDLVVVALENIISLAKRGIDEIEEMKNSER